MVSYADIKIIIPRSMLSANIQTSSSSLGTSEHKKDLLHSQI